MFLRLVLPLSQFLSQTYHYSFFFFLGFQITILNSPTQFLSLSHSVLLLRSLSRLCRVCVCVYGCLAVGLGIAILVGMWPCMYVDVNECNVCSVCMFLVWDFGLTVSYFADVVKMGLQEVRLTIVNSSIPFRLINLGFVDLFVLFDFCSFGLWFVFWVLISHGSELVLISLCVLWVDLSWYGLVLISLFFS